ncbi:MAG: tetratricopeptide repeat protein [Bryobacteraceae bacterium]
MKSTRLLSESARNARVWLALARAYQALDQPAQAKDAASRAAELAPDDPTVLHGLAVFYAEVQSWALAGEFERRYAKASLDQDAVPRSARYFLLAGQARAAFRLLQKAIKRTGRTDLDALLEEAHSSSKGTPAHPPRLA